MEQYVSESKSFTVFSQKLMGYLVSKGFVLVDMRPDRFGSRRNVFFFNDSPQLREAIEDYKKGR